MPGLTDRMDFVVRGALSTVYYRSLHIVSLPNNIREVIGYAEEQAQNGALGGTVSQPWDGIGLEVYAWDDIRLGDDLRMDAWVFGFQFGPQTVLWRKGWWKGNFTRRNLAFIVNTLTGNLGFDIGPDTPKTPSSGPGSDDVTPRRMQTQDDEDTTREGRPLGRVG